jgi:hypothetical protein
LDTGGLLFLVIVGAINPTDHRQPHQVLPGHLGGHLRPDVHRNWLLAGLAFLVVAIIMALAK